MMLNKGSATNVQVALAEAGSNGGNVLHIGTDPGQLVALSETGDGTVDYKATYMAVGGAATPGTVDASVMFSLTYN
ncbi:Fimbrial protein [compost metagenome]